MRTLVAMMLALAACRAPNAQAVRALSETLVLEGTRECHFVTSGSQTYLCRQFPFERVDAIAAYIETLAHEGWHLVSPGHGEGMMPADWEHHHTTLWFERPSPTGDCSQVTSINAVQVMLPNDQLELEVLISLNRPEVCGDQRQLR